MHPQSNLVNSRQVRRCGSDQPFLRTLHEPCALTSPCRVPLQENCKACDFEPVFCYICACLATERSRLFLIRLFYFFFFLIGRDGASPDSCASPCCWMKQNVTVIIIMEILHGPPAADSTQLWVLEGISPSCHINEKQGFQCLTYLLMKNVWFWRRKQPALVC